MDFEVASLARTDYLSDHAPIDLLTPAHRAAYVGFRPASFRFPLS